MKDKLLNDIALTPVIDFNDTQTQKSYERWMRKSKLLQVRSISALTAVLYIVAATTDHLIAPPEILSQLTLFHLYILPPFLLLIFLLSFKKQFTFLTQLLLMTAPVIATVGNLLVTTHLEHPAMRLTEIYLIIFWVFTVSGLRLWPATISASLIVITTCSIFISYFDLPLEDFVMHCFWLLSSFSFGFLAAFLLEHSYKTIFVHQEHLKLLADTDKLTGLYNRSKLDILLKKELKRSQRYESPFGLILIDFDYFKDINDTYGHQVGDEALIEIAELLREHLRVNDIAVRWGGEEFIIVYLDIKKEELLKLAHELCKKIEDHQFKKVGQQTASIGVTLFHKNDTINKIIKRADQALYEAKSSGRNRVVFR